MSKLSKIVILVFLTLAISVGAFAISRFSEAENGENNVLTSDTSSSETLTDSTSSTEDQIYVCPNAASLEEVNPNCERKIDLKLGETVNGMTLTITNYEGKDYYAILGFENGGAGVYSEKADLSTQIEITEMIYGGIDILNEITQTVGDKKSPLLLSELKDATIDLEDYTPDGKLNPSQKRKLKMKFKFLETAGNEYQGKSINVKFKFLATQEK